jgi:cobalt-zinc-cadmium efflux system outer membrane protein
VRLAEREFQYSKRALERSETLILPQADTALKRASVEFASGDIDPDAYQDRLEEAAAVAQNHREAVVRHRRSMLDLNTAVGLRLLP